MCLGDFMCFCRIWQSVGIYLHKNSFLFNTKKRFLFETLLSSLVCLFATPDWRRFLKPTQDTVPVGERWCLGLPWGSAGHSSKKATWHILLHSHRGGSDSVETWRPRLLWCLRPPLFLVVPFSFRHSQNFPARLAGPELIAVACWVSLGACGNKLGMPRGGPCPEVLNSHLQSVELEIPLFKASVSDVAAVQWSGKVFT